MFLKSPLIFFKKQISVDLSFSLPFILFVFLFLRITFLKSFVSSLCFHVEILTFLLYLCNFSCSCF
jgi:hypothetical protein